MALKRRITAEDHAKLADHLKGEYIKKGEDFFLDTEENDDAKELKAARDKEKADRVIAQKEAKKNAEDLAALKEEMEELRAEGENGKKSEVEKLTAKHAKELEKLTKTKDTELQSVKGQLQSILVDDSADKLANELFRFTPDIYAAQLIKPRMKLVEVDGKPSAVALDGEGKEISLADLRTELLANPKLADILKPASRASGGGANHGQGSGNGGGGAKTLTEQHQEAARAQGLAR